MFQVEVAGAKGTFYILETSTNLVNRTPAMTNSGPFTIQESGPVNEIKFYRARTDL